MNLRKEAKNERMLIERIIETLPFRYSISAVTWILILYGVWLLSVFLLNRVYPIPFQVMAEMVGGAFFCLFYGVTAVALARRVKQLFYSMKEKVTPLVEESDLQTFNNAFESTRRKITSKKSILLGVIFFVAYLVVINRFVYEIVQTFIAPRLFWIIGWGACYVWAALCWILLSLIMGTSVFFAITVFRFIRNLARLKLKLKPLDPDRMGGLKPLSNISLYNSALISILCLMLPAFYGFPIQDLLVWSGALAFIFLSLFFFLGPLLSLHNLMAEKKHKEMEAWSNVFQTLIERIPKRIQEASTMEHLDERTLQNARLSREIFREVERMKEWPIDLRMLGKLFGPIILPVLLLVLERYLPIFLQFL